MDRNPRTWRVEHFREYFYDLFISFTYNYSTYKYTIYDSCLHNIIIIISLHHKHGGSVIFLFINNIQRNDNSSFYKHAAPSWRAPVVYYYIIIIIFFSHLDTYISLKHIQIIIFFYKLITVKVLYSYYTLNSIMSNIDAKQ